MESEKTRVTGGDSTRHLRLGFELVFASYLSVLFAFLEELRPRAWSLQGRYQYFWHPHAVSLGQMDFALFYAELFLIPAIVIFGCLRLISRSAAVRPLLHAVGGFVAVVGFPFVCLYAARRPLFPIILEPAIAGICFLLWAYRKWLVSAWLNIPLLILHYALWFFFCMSVIGIPSMHRLSAWGSIWDYMGFVYPLLGFSYSLVWSVYFRHSEATPSLTVVQS